MNKAKKDIINWCGQVGEAIVPAELSEGFIEKITQLRQSVEQQELLVPVVGSFSSGKSTLINKIIGDNILPTAITPETSLATELRYSTEQRIEAVKEDGSITRFDVSEIKQVTEDAAKYSFVRLYLDSAKLKDLEPLVLVDMPGFDSPLDAHNKAIMNYIDRGSHYVVLASVQEGTVSKSLLRRIREINALDRGMSFFLTKSDLKPQSDVRNLVEHFTESLRDNSDYEGEVIAISQASPDAVVTLLKSISADSILFGLYRPFIEGISSDLIDAVNIKISAFRKDNSSLELAMSELDGALRKLQSKSEDEIESISRRNAGGEIINNVLLDVGNALERSLEELVAIAKSGDGAATERCLMDIVRAEGNISINTHLGKINKEIIADMSGSLSNLDKVMRDLDANHELTKTLAVTIAQQLGSLAKGMAIAARTSAVVSIGSKVAGGAVGGGFAGPVGAIIGVVVALLPEIIGFLFAGHKEAKQAEKLRSIFLTQVFPQIKAKLRPELQSVVAESVQGMIEQVRVQYEVQIAQKKADLEAAMKEKALHSDQKEEVIARLEGVREFVKSSSDELQASYN